jgi:hypothetical protein
LEKAVQRATEVSWARTRDELLVAMRREFVTRDLLDERLTGLRVDLLDSIRREFVTRELFEERMGALRAELLGKIQTTREELLGRIEALRLALDRKITIWSLVLLFAIVLMNKDALEFVARLVGLVK